MHYVATLAHLSYAATSDEPLLLDTATLPTILFYVIEIHLLTQCDASTIRQSWQAQATRPTIEYGPKASQKRAENRSHLRA